MPATLTPDLLAHIAAVRDGEPDDADLLVLADRLQEEGDEDRAELIRVGVELGRVQREAMDDGTDCEQPTCAICSKRRSLVARKAALLARNPAWLSVACPACKGSCRDDYGRGSGFGVCPICSGTGDLLTEPNHYGHVPATRAELTRGFVTVTLPSALCWRECGRCGGDGKAHGSDRPFEWNASTDYGKCVVCRGEKVSPHPALAAVLDSPAGPWVRRVVVSDREPYHNGAGWCWYNAARNVSSLARAAQVPDAAELPEGVFLELRGWSDAHTPGKRWRPYPTAEAAADALARAVPLWVRRCRP